MTLNTHHHRILILLGVLCCAAFQGHAATLRLEAPSVSSAEDTGVWRLHIESERGEFIAAFQADLQLTPSNAALQELHPGATLDEAQKNASFSVLGPGKVRILVAGLNQNTIEDGLVLELRVAAPPEETVTVRLHHAILANPYGKAIPVQLRNATESGEGARPARGCACAPEGPAAPRHPGDVLVAGLAFAVMLLATWPRFRTSL